MDVGYVTAFLGGVLTLISPCSALLLPAFFAYAVAGPTRLMAHTGIFYLGLATTLVPLGVAASAAGALVNEHRETFVMVASLVVIALGIVQLSGRGFGVGIAARAPGRNPTSVTSVFALGAIYGVAGVCSGPILGAVLALSAIGSDPLYGGMLLAVYALGMAAPLFVLAVLWSRFDLGRRRWFRGRELTFGRWRVHTTQLASGVLFIVIGAALLITDGTAGIGGLFSVDTEYQAQLWARELGQRIPDVAAIAVAVIAFVALGWLYRRRRRRASGPPEDVRADAGTPHTATASDRTADEET